MRAAVSGARRIHTTISAVEDLPIEKSGRCISFRGLSGALVSDHGKQLKVRTVSRHRKEIIWPSVIPFRSS